MVEGSGHLPKTVHLGSVFIFVSAAWSGLTGLWLLVSPISFAELIMYGEKADVDLAYASGAASQLSTQGFLTLAFSVLFAWFGVKIRQGRNWARIAVTVPVVISALHQLAGFMVPVRTLLVVLNVLSVALNVLILIMLWHRASAAHFRRKA